MSPVFAHGQLRLYLLALLADGPRHGYEVIQDLQDRFHGLYSPSAGTVYPRLAKLEEEGLVARSDEGRKAVYQITDAGRAEVRERATEIAGLQIDLDDSVRRLAEQVRSTVQDRAAELRAELRAAAQAARASAQPAADRPAQQRQRPGRHPEHDVGQARPDHAQPGRSHPDHPDRDRPHQDRPPQDRPPQDRPYQGHPHQGHPHQDRVHPDESPNPLEREAWLWADPPEDRSWTDWVIGSVDREWADWRGGSRRSSAGRSQDWAELEMAVAAFRSQARREWRRQALTPEQVRDILAIIADASARVTDVLRRG